MLLHRVFLYREKFRSLDIWRELSLTLVPYTCTSYDVEQPRFC